MVTTMTRLRTALSFAATSALVLGMSACATETSTTESGVKVIKEGKLTFCTSLPYEPFEVEKDGEIVGFDIDLANEIAKANDLELALEVTGFEGIQSGQALNSGKCDMAVAGMTINDERKEAIDFTDPYFDATQALLTKDPSLDSFEALDGKTLAVMSGTTGEDYAKENAPAGVKQKSFENLGLQTSALTAGTVDAVIQDNGPLLDYAAKNPEYSVTVEFDTGEQYGMAVKKDSNDELLKSANETLAKIREDGTYDELYKKWFGKAPAASE